MNTVLKHFCITGILHTLNLIKTVGYSVGALYLFYFNPTYCEFQTVRRQYSAVMLQSNKGALEIEQNISTTQKLGANQRSNQSTSTSSMKTHVYICWIRPL